MADSPNRAGRVRRSRGSSRVNSARSSTVFDDHLHPHGPYVNHSLRPAESRFSLHEQFAATRREYEFGDDDGSSTFERVTAASDADEDGFEDRTITLDDLPTGGDEADVQEDELADGDFYDLLCLPRDQTLSHEQIRRAYYRLFLLLYPDSHPDNEKDVAQPFFNRLQQAFETLIHPQSRADYDLRQGDELASGEDSMGGQYDGAVQDQRRRGLGDTLCNSSDLGIRLDATRFFQPSLQSRRRNGSFPPLRALDFTMSQSWTVGVPQLGGLLHQKIRLTQEFLNQRRALWSRRLPSIALESKSLSDDTSEPDFHLAVPTLTVSGSVYGVIEEMFLIPITILSDRYQPLLPLSIPRHRVIQLAENRLSPLVSVNLRQEILHKAPASRDGDNRWTKTAVEVESDLLPEPSLTTRLSHTILLPNDPVPVNVEASVTSGSRLTRRRPRLGLSVQRNIEGGTAFARVDSGDWSIWPRETCKFFTEFSRVTRNFFYAEFPLKTAPSLEIGYKTTPCERGAIANYADTPRGESGMRGLDHEMDYAGEGSWSASIAATPDSVGGFLRYSKDLAISQLGGSGAAPSRLEVEFCSNSLWDRYLAVRNLWTVGKTTRLGLELGLSSYNYHVSLYWSRHNHRLSIPFLVSPRAYLSTKIVFWSTVVPFLTLAGFQFYGRRSKTPRRNRREIKREDIPQYVAKKRAEADELTVLLAQPVAARQKMEAQRNGLVIHSAKFGLKDVSNGWAGEEVADVTVAVAALVDEGRLVIPSGLRKSNLPGFWDPAPLREKVLHVRYTFQGKEATAEVRGREEFVLPPPAMT